MNAGVIALILIGVVVLAPLLYGVLIFNRLVSLRAHIRDSWAGVQVELKRRYDLIPNLVETVKGYARHEREVLERVTALRDRAASNTGPASGQSADEIALNAGLRRLFAVAEAYPELKADRMFRDLQGELVNTEDRLAATRRFYNGNVREMNELVGQFPSNVIAGMTGFSAWEYFELDDETERAAPRVGWGGR